MDLKIRKARRKDLPLVVALLAQMDRPTPLSLTYGAIVKFGKNPNVAKLFLSWLNTAEGALTFEKITERGNYLVACTKSAELVKGLKDVSTAARSLRSLSDYLERNPQALIFGKPDSKEN